MRHIYIGLILMFFASGAFAQAGYHRIYNLNESGDTTLHHLATASTGGELVSILAREIDGAYKTIVLTKQDKKGSYDAKMEYDFGQDSIDNIYNAEIVYNKGGGGVNFTFTLEVNGEFQTYVGDCNTPDMDNFKAIRVDGIDHNSTNILGNTLGTPLIDECVDTTNIHGMSDTSVVISRLDKDHQQMWTQRYPLSDTLGTSFTAVGYGLDVSLDTTIYSAGLLEDNRLYQMVIDSQGQQIWSRSYGFDIEQSVPQVRDVAAVSLGRSAVAGFYEPFPGSSVSFAVLTDTVGEVIWAKQILINNGSTEVYHVAESTDGNIIVGGKFFRQVDSIEHFTASLDQVGNINWITSYGDNLVVPDLDHMAMDVDPDGIVLAGNGYSEEGREGLTFIKQINVGTTPCSDSIMQMSFLDITVVTDTLVIDRQIGITYTSDTLAYEAESYNNIIEPILNPTPRNMEYCPNELVMQLLTANVSNVDTANVEYMWKDEAGILIATTDTVTVTLDPGEEAMYFPTVIISENVCYELCDTIMLTRSAAPGVTIAQDVSNFCATGEVVLIANINNGTAPFNILWSTGETGDNISVVPGAEYSVMVTDTCGDVANASEFINTPMNQVFANIDVDYDNCKGTAVVFAAPESTLGSVFTYQWDDDDGSTNSSININSPLQKEFTVTVTDECGDTSVESELVDVDVPLRIISAEIVDNTCEDGGVGRFVYEVEYEGNLDTFSRVEVDNPGTFGIRRAMGENPLRISFDAGTHALNFENGCFLDTASFLCPVPCLDYGNIFFPSGAIGSMGDMDDRMADSLDVSFGPVLLECSFIPTEEIIKNYEFKVFNRSGQEVFAATELNERWDGTINNEPAPSEAYVWYAVFIVDENDDGIHDDPMVESIKLKGDVTLVR